jgi:hypothetical protein
MIRQLARHCGGGQGSKGMKESTQPLRMNGRYVRFIFCVLRGADRTIIHTYYVVCLFFGRESTWACRAPIGTGIGIGSRDPRGFRCPSLKEGTAGENGSQLLVRGQWPQGPQLQCYANSRAALLPAVGTWRSAGGGAGESDFHGHQALATRHWNSER